jgi:branched-chain amino acid transport system ATP-binding protein
MKPLLEVADLSVTYRSGGRAVHRAGLEVGDGECVVIIGPNGAGKSSLVRAIAGTLPYDGVSLAGSVRFDGASVLGAKPWRVARSGLCFIPERDKLFTTLSVDQNLRMLSRLRGQPGRGADHDETLAMFPILEPLLAKPAGLLSGGEQQVLALAAALRRRPRLLIIDEPLLGLAPIMVQEFLTALGRVLAQFEFGLLLVDQNAAVLNLANRLYSMSEGRLSAESVADYEFRLRKEVDHEAAP